MSELVRVCAPCRLHFGMFCFGRTDRPQFGGVGVMVEPPCVEVAFRPAERWEVCGDHAERGRRFIDMASRAWELPETPACAVTIHAPPDHIGLGIGTQLGLAIAAGLRRYRQLTPLPAEQLAAAVGRGRRSAVGLHGFARGGLIVDAGMDDAKQADRLADCVQLPSSWRFVLVRADDTRGLTGEREVEAFARLPAVPDSVTETLWRITMEEVVPAAKKADCQAFGEAVFRFGRIAGKCFAAVQGGPFANRHVADLVAAIREYGVAGVGQSSWGPTVFAIVSDAAAAERFVQWLRSRPDYRDCDVTIAMANNTGAIVHS